MIALSFHYHCIIISISFQTNNLFYIIIIIIVIIIIIIIQLIALGGMATVSE